MQYICNHATRSKKAEDSVSMQRPVQKKSKQVGCKARLNVVCYDNDPDVVHFEYKNEHSGHVPLSLEDVRYLPNSPEVKQRILDELRKGYNVREVRSYMQRQYQHLAPTHRDSYISTVDVYNIYYRYRQEVFCSKDEDDFTSVDLWLKDLQSAGYYTWIDTVDQDPTQQLLLTAERFTFGFCAPWQMELLVNAKFI